MVNNLKEFLRFNMLKKIIIIVSLSYLLVIGSANAEPQLDEAVFAMGCFWCAESEFRNHQTNELLPGITKLRVGYAGGTKPNPTYQSHEGYKEALKITYDPKLISYRKLLTIFWNNVDPFDANGQFCDKGFPYTAAIFYTNDKQKSQAQPTKSQVQKQLNKSVVTEILPYTTFVDAEAYHQNYQAKNPVQYKYYRWNCGRDRKLKAIWHENHFEAQ